MLGGVCEGVGRHLDIDPLIPRIVVAALTVFGGAGLVVYLLAWLTIPDEDTGTSWAAERLHRDPQRVVVAGLGVAAVAAVLTLVGAVGFAAPKPGPVIALSAVALVLLAVFTRRSASDPAVGFSAGGSTGVPPAAPDDSRAAQPPGDLPAGPSRPPRSTRPRSRLVPVALAVMAVALGGVWFADASGADVHPSVYPATVLLLCAAALILGAWYGRARLLIPLGFLAALATAASVVVGPGPYGERIYRPTSAAEVRPAYEHGAGRIEVRLDEVTDPEALDGRTIRVTSRVGEVELVLPTSVDATVVAHVDGGQITGIASAPDGGNDQEARLVPDDDADPDVTVIVDLRYGQVGVRRFDCPGRPVPATGVSTNEWTGETSATACD